MLHSTPTIRIEESELDERLISLSHQVLPETGRGGLPVPAREMADAFDDEPIVEREELQSQSARHGEAGRFEIVNLDITGPRRVRSRRDHGEHHATRLGASGFQIGLLAAVPAVVTLIFAIPAGGWLEKRTVGQPVGWGTVLNRAGYLLWIPLPWLFGNQGQVWSLIVLALLMGLPLTVVTVGFNAMFAAAVPSEWRAYVAGGRNIVYAVTFIASSLGSGYLLDHVPFPIGYQIVFGIGFLGAMLSSYQLFFIKTFPVANHPDPKPAPVEKTRPHHGWTAALRIDIWRGPFAAILLGMLFFHFAQYMAFPLLPIYMVRVLNLTDAEIGIGTALST